MLQLDRRLRRPGAEIAFADLGSGRPLVLTHGAGMDHRMYEHQVRALVDAGNRVVVWDLRGHGASTLHGRRFTASDALDDLAALLVTTGTEQPVLVGHSLGGNLSQAFVRSHPDVIAGLIVIDATWNTGPLSVAGRAALRLAAPSLSLIPARALPGILARASAVTPDAVARAADVFAAMPKPLFLDVWRATASLVDPDPSYRTPVPLGLIRGARDATGNIAAAMPRWAAAEGITEQVIPDAGHLVTEDAPQSTTEAIRRILSTPPFLTPSR